MVSHAQRNKAENRGINTMVKQQEADVENNFKICWNELECFP